ncbi:MAG TPA: ELM1/GtrOC1 family putative glycosyltransferase [Patescibacteria group bacterium]|nr:ELM1/GtrOC1 family putative glycosyltransferase [Patescibacteria group bacterium]
MNKNSIEDYLAYTLVRLVGPVLRMLPLSVSLFAGKKLGGLYGALDRKHRAIVYANLKTAFGSRFSPSRLKGITRAFYQSFGQSLIEIFLLPRFDAQYFQDYIKVEGLEHIRGALKKGKGAILVAAHTGSWELSNIVSAGLDFPVWLFVRDQRHPRLDGLLNSYRLQKGCRLIQRYQETRELIRVLKNNQVVGMTVDQGGKDGTLVSFFGKNASMSSGAVRMALKYGVPLLPVICTRLRGPYHKIVVEAPLELEQAGAGREDLRLNLQRLVSVFERHISLCPHEYLWTYKVWKYTDQKNVLILSDGKTGHLRQAQAAAGIIVKRYNARGMTAKVDTVEVKYKNRFVRTKNTLADGLWQRLAVLKPDIIVSCGSCVAGLAYLLARENLAKTVVVMRPSLASMKKFDLVIVPAHDRIRKAKNTVVTEGALNVVDEAYLKTQGEALRARIGSVKKPLVGFLIGGTAKGFRLDAAMMRAVLSQLKSALEKLDAELLLTTSRRTPADIERLVKEALGDYPRCKYMVIANEQNPAFALGGILALSGIVVISPESISMISEAVRSGAYVITFDAPGLRPRHQAFLRRFAQKRYLYSVRADALAGTIENLWLSRPQIHVPEDDRLVAEAVEGLL